jgi:hypothetical protein
MPKPHNTAESEMATEYDFSKGVRGKYAARYAAGSNIAVIDKDLAALFPNSETVNQTLRLVAKLRQMPVKIASRPRRNRSKPKAALKTRA